MRSGSTTAWLLRAGAFLCVAAAVGCGGGGGGSSPSPSTPTTTPTTSPSGAPTTTPAPTAAPTSTPPVGPTATPTPVLYVAAQNANGPVVAYPALANGSPAPLFTLAPTGFNKPAALAADYSGNLYVLNTNTGGGVLVFPAGSTTSTSTITSSTFVYPLTNVAVDVKADVYVLGSINVANYGSTIGIAVFPPGSGAGATPTTTFTNSMKVLPVSLSVDIAGNIYVATNDTSGGYNSLLEFGPGSTVSAVPSRTISGPTTLLGQNGLNAVALDPSGNIYASVSQNGSNSTNHVVEFATGTTNGDQAPLREIAGSLTQLNAPSAMAFDAAGELFVQNTSANGSYVTVFAPGASGNVAPLRVITEQVGGVAITGAGIAVSPP